MNPKYSVLMSTYQKDSPDHLKIAVNSMLNQTVAPEQIVIVEDGEIPAQLQTIIMDFKKRYPKIFNVEHNIDNLGLGLSLRNGLRICRNEFVARMDADDIARSDRCEKQLQYMLKHPETAIVGGQIQEFYGSESNIVGERIVPLTDSDIKSYMKKRCPLNHVTVMFRKSDVKSVGGYRHLPYNEDYDLWIRMSLAGFEFANLPDILVDVRVGHDMYERRGGITYFRSEYKIQKLMLKKKLINRCRYIINISERFILQVLLPNRMRSIVFKRFARVQSVK